MREINRIVIHCTATGSDATISAIQNYWRNTLHWKNPGYHIIIPANGEIEFLQPTEKPSNGARGYNEDAIHVAWIGGLKTDDRTPEQKLALATVVKMLHKQFPQAEICGHRDLPKVAKACPRFDVKPWIKQIL